MLPLAVGIGCTAGKRARDDDSKVSANPSVTAEPSSPAPVEPDASSGTTAAGTSPSADVPPVGSSEPAIVPAAPLGSGAEEPTEPEVPQPVCPPDCGPTTDEFYDNEKLATIRIEIGEEALDGYLPEEWLYRLFDLRDQCDRVYIRSSFAYESPDGVGDVALDDVGIRARGSMGFAVNEAKGFKLDFHKPFYEEANPESERRRFADINRLNTLSLEPAHSAGLDYDATHLFQCLTYKLMRDFDVLAPQCNHLKVYVNGEYYSLMQNVEETDHGRFLAHRFGATDGIMVKAAPSVSACGYKDGSADLTYRGDAFADYTSPQMFDIERGTEADLEEKLFPMFKCADRGATPDDEEYRSCISDWLDVEEWLRLIAAESIIPELESLMYDRNINLYFRRDESEPNGGRWLVSIWDVDATLNGQRCSSGGGGGGGGFPGGPGSGSSGGSACDPFNSVSSLFRGSRLDFVDRLTTVFRDEYCEAMVSFLDDVYLPSKIDDMAGVMEPAMVDEPITSQQTWQDAISTTRGFIESNGQAMRDLVQAACD